MTMDGRTKARRETAMDCMTDGGSSDETSDGKRDCAVAHCLHDSDIGIRAFPSHIRNSAGSGRCRSVLRHSMTYSSDTLCGLPYQTLLSFGA